MGNYTIFGGFENPRRGGQARNLTTNVPKILYLKSSSEQIFSKSCRWVPLTYGTKLPRVCLVLLVSFVTIFFDISWRNKKLPLGLRRWPLHRFDVTT